MPAPTGVHSATMMVGSATTGLLGEAGGQPGLAAAAACPVSCMEEGASREVEGTTPAAAAAGAAVAVSSAAAAGAAGDHDDEMVAVRIPGTAEFQPAQMYHQLQHLLGDGCRLHSDSLTRCCFCRRRRRW